MLNSCPGPGIRVVKDNCRNSTWFQSVKALNTLNARHGSTCWDIIAKAAFVYAFSGFSTKTYILWGRSTKTMTGTPIEGSPTAPEKTKYKTQK